MGQIDLSQSIKILLGNDYSLVMIKKRKLPWKNAKTDQIQGKRSSWLDNDVFLRDNAQNDQVRRDAAGEQ